MQVRPRVMSTGDWALGLGDPWSLEMVHVARNEVRLGLTPGSCGSRTDGTLFPAGSSLLSGKLV